MQELFTEMLSKQSIDLVLIAALFGAPLLAALLRFPGFAGKKPARLRNTAITGVITGVLGAGLLMVLTANGVTWDGDFASSWLPLAVLAGVSVGAVVYRSGRAMIQKISEERATARKIRDNAQAIADRNECDISRDGEIARGVGVIYKIEQAPYRETEITCALSSGKPMKLTVSNGEIEKMEVVQEAYKLLARGITPELEVELAIRHVRPEGTFTFSVYPKAMKLI